MCFVHFCTGLLEKAILLLPGPNHDFAEKALDKKGPKKMPSELASLLHTNASSLEEGEESRREATPALSKAPSTSTVQDLEERKLTVMFEFQMEQQQKRDEKRGREAEDREKVRKGGCREGRGSEERGRR